MTRLQASISRRESQTWQPILTTEMSRRALAVVAEIVDCLPGPSEIEPEDISLCSGSTGIALLCAYLSRAGLDDDENATQFLARSINSVPSLSLGPSLYSGFTGIAWATSHLLAQLPDMFDSDDDPNQLIDEALKTYLDQSPWQDHYDLIIGLVGIGVYALERLPHKTAAACIELIVDRLDEISVRSVNGVTWFTGPDLLADVQREWSPEGHYNLGLAHGVPGVIALLGQICAAELALPKARPLLDGAVAWLLRHKSLNTTESQFPKLIVPGVEDSNCRLAWCYGDAGLSAALMVAARCVEEKTWEREAIAIARNAASRPPDTAGVKDATFCHGTAGLAHIFNRFFQATGEETFRNAACYWVERTLEMRRAGKGVAGYSAYQSDNYGREWYWADQVGILEGATGIALALLAASTEVEPAWDRMFLVSIPQPPNLEPWAGKPKENTSP